MPNSKTKKPKLLLHVCCAVCAAYICKLLEPDFSVSLFFYNPNIYGENEYTKRLDEAVKIAKINNLDLIAGDYGHDCWLGSVKGRENDQEGGERCGICYHYRLDETAKRAKADGFDYFSTTLTISSHKKWEVISAIGNELSIKHNIGYLDRNFKKQDGFKKTMELSRELGLYRQNYCGCEFSLRERS